MKTSTAVDSHRLRPYGKNDSESPTTFYRRALPAPSRNKETRPTTVYGTDTVELVFRNHTGATDTQLLYSADLAGLTVERLGCADSPRAPPSPRASSHPVRNSSKGPHSVATSICQKLHSTCVICCHERSAAGLGRQDG